MGERHCPVGMCVSNYTKTIFNSILMEVCNFKHCVASHSQNKWKNWKLTRDFLSCRTFLCAFHPVVTCGAEHLGLCFLWSDSQLNNVLSRVACNLIWSIFFMCYPLRHWRLTPFFLNKDKGFCLCSHYSNTKLAWTLGARLVSFYSLKIITFWKQHLLTLKWKLVPFQVSGLALLCILLFRHLTTFLQKLACSKFVVLMT